MYDDILVPTDGSEGTSEILRHAFHIAADNDATLHGLYVVDKRIYLAADEDDREDVATEMESDGAEALSDLREEAEATDGVPVETEVRRGVPYRDILEYATDAGIDLIVMGTHGRTGRDRITNLGSTAERVVKDSEFPVLTVRITD